MTSLLEPSGRILLPDGWRDDWSNEEKAVFIARLRTVRSAGDPNSGPSQMTWNAPSELAADLFDDYVHVPHLDPIDTAFVDADQGKVSRILICTPPQVGKSTTAAEAGPLWWLSRHPRARVTVASYASSLADRRGKRVRDTIAGHTKVGDELIPNAPRLGLALSPGSTSVSQWDLDTGGGMICMGVGGGLTGFGSDFMIVDDPHKNRQEANSLTYRKAAWEWWQSTVVTRMAPDAPVILIMTRWHEDDLAARVLKNEGREDEGGTWRVISLPAIAEDRDPKTKRAIVDPLGRAAGDPLTHPKLPGAGRDRLLDFWLSMRRAVGSREWPALYQQRPAPPEGAIFKHDWLTLGRISPSELPQLIARVVSVDPSATANQQSDECGIVVCGKDARAHGYVWDDRSKIATPAEWGRTVLLACLDHEIDVVVAEQNQGYEMVQDVLKNAWKALRDGDPEHGLPPDPRAADRLPPRVVKAHSRVNKTIRAEPVAAIYERIEAHHVGDQLDVLEDQMTGWTGEGDSPDRMDALVHGLTYLLKGPDGPGRSLGTGDLTL